MNPPRNFILAEKVDERKLRELFNDPETNRILRMQTSHEVTVREEPATAGQVAGTMSFIKDWYGYDETRGESFFVATVHYYKRPDGSIGASGKQDPKIVVVGGVRYIDP